ncbi:unnamed protein product [Pieris brassicae]|uniref:Uncharacterized protein n=1 Tax=Pieris brassicae TaxID=7116 RepID=A0A9P0SHZ8_PIEBR|nr:unnamed protein product [Pieris brassicae]
MEKRPPDPPDPPDKISSPVESMHLSSPVLSQPGVKLRLNSINEGLAEPTTNDLKPMTDVRSSADDVNHGFYSHPSLTDSPKSYHMNVKGPFLVHVSCPESDPYASSSISSIKLDSANTSPASSISLSRPITIPSQVSPKTTSYRKTVFLPPSCKPTLGRSYEKVANEAITSNLPSSLSNGCALSAPSPINNEVSPNDNLLDCLY